MTGRKYRRLEKKSTSTIAGEQNAKKRQKEDSLTMLEYDGASGTLEG